MAERIETAAAVPGTGRERLERVLLSIGDDTALTEAHVEPVEEVLALLHANFGRAAPERASLSLQISVGRGGARLSHSHATQYAYVEQTLLLWREILGNLSLMWSLAEAGLSSPQESLVVELPHD